MLKICLFFNKSFIFIILFSLILSGCARPQHPYKMPLNPNLSVLLPKEDAISYLVSLKSKLSFFENGIKNDNLDIPIPYEYFILTVEAMAVSDNIIRRNVKIRIYLDNSKRVRTKKIKRNIFIIEFLTKGGAGRELAIIRKKVEMAITALVSLGVKYQP